MNSALVVSFWALVFLHSAHGAFGCEDNEEYKDSGDCESNPDDCGSGCYCKDGYIRTSKGCIPDKNCHQCNDDEIYMECGRNFYCGQSNTVQDDDFCEPGCYCPDGYFRSGSSNRSACVPESECYHCNKHEIFMKCGRNFYCGQSNTVQDDDFCKPGCYCMDGYFRSGSSNRSTCVRESECYHCKEHEIYMKCGRNFYCGQSNTVQDDDLCKPGCFCMDGYIRAGPSNKTLCVPEEECEEAEKCPCDEEYKTCGPAHQESCDGKSHHYRCGGKIRPHTSEGKPPHYVCRCPPKCVPDCFCKDGFIRKHNDTQTMRYECIKQDDCPKLWNM